MSRVLELCKEVVERKGNMKFLNCPSIWCPFWRCDECPFCGLSITCMYNNASDNEINFKIAQEYIATYTESKEGTR